MAVLFAQPIFLVKTEKQRLWRGGDEVGDGHALVFMCAEEVEGRLCSGFHVASMKLDGYAAALIRIKYWNLRIIAL